ncbi:NF038122 family metalloprotease [Paludisphaera borealis]|uniref:PEP-CTERM protein-sorting domain-containing protein n=1 Tax=Paludisphaera borealis TaxID=1387353 RepID=A0A1U7CWJ6_9BACT|nr:NF038122 family metalloprotease [Paludisphaera borealis]APW63317.1 hypothetical protein BSF38_04881 [Paludisphaera borealis]
MKNVDGLTGRPQRHRFLAWGLLAPVVAASMLCSNAQAYSGLTINATFDSSITSLPDAVAIEGAINSAISVLEHDISSPITVSILFQNMNSGLGESTSGVYTLSYFDYYNALKAHMTTPEQLTALASLGQAPTSSSSPNPVNGSTSMEISAPQGRMLGFDTPGVVTGPGGTYDTIIGLNTSITSPPQGLAGYYGLQAVANHELDEALGIGGLGSFLGTSLSGVGSLDLYRYSAPGVRSFTTDQNANSYFSLDGGKTVLSYFNQIAGADYGDWAGGANPQVQDAFGTPGTNPALGANELASFSAIGYSLSAQAVPEPSSFAMLGTAILFFSGHCWSRSKQRARVAA